MRKTKVELKEMHSFDLEFFKDDYLPRKLIYKKKKVIGIAFVFNQFFVKTSMQSAVLFFGNGKIILHSCVNHGSA